MIYVLEDDNSIREFVVYTLCHMDMDAKGFERPSEFWAALKSEKPELVLLDIMLPEEDGLSILKKIREDTYTRDIPIIMLTAKNTEYDKVLGLDTGADDYVAKPFGMMELVARIKALQRRAEKGYSHRDDETIYTFGDAKVYPSRHIVKVNDSTINLTLKEYELLCMLLENRNKVLTRDQILNKIWGYGFDGESRTVDVHVRTLRTKLGYAGNYIETVRGVGYRIGDE